jgi:hypothetical protein
VHCEAKRRIPADGWSVRHAYREHGISAASREKGQDDRGRERSSVAPSSPGGVCEDAAQHAQPVALGDNMGAAGSNQLLVEVGVIERAMLEVIRPEHSPRIVPVEGAECPQIFATKRNYNGDVASSPVM